MKFPSVTRVLGVFADFSRIPPHVLNHAAARGTKVHAACSAIAKGLWCPPQEPEVQPYVDSFRRWFDRYVESVSAVEVELVDEKLGFCGHPDLICRIKGDKWDELTVVDLKTPATKNRLWSAQLAAYRHLAETEIDPPKRTASLRLRKDGSRALFDEYEDQARDLAAFLSALNAVRWFGEVNA